MSQKLSVENLTKSPFLRGSAVLIVGNLVANFGNYIYNLFMGRFLGPADYGVMASIVALLIIVSVPSVALTYIVTKYTTIFNSSGNTQQLSAFWRTFNKFFLILSVALIILFTLMSAPLAKFLNIDSHVPVILLGALLGVSLLSSINNSVLQGLLRFNMLAASGILTVVVKITVGFALVLMGFSVGGALGGFLLAGIFPYLFAFWPLRHLWQKSEKVVEIPWKDIRTYSQTALVSTFGLTLLYTSDVVLVKHFFSAEEAGLYSAISLIARVILFFTAPIVSVMFPLISVRHAKNDRYLNLFFLSLLFTAISSLALTTFYTLFPEFTVRFFFGNQYLSAAPYLGRFGLFLSLYSLCNVFVSFYLSINRSKIANLSLVFGISQVILLWFFHDSITTVLNVVSLIALGFLLICSSYVLSLTKIRSFANIKSVLTR